MTLDFERAGTLALTVGLQPRVLPPPSPKRYTYLGDKHTLDALRGAQCDPVRRADGKCIVSTKLASALVEFEDATRHVVARRRLRLNSKRR